MRRLLALGLVVLASPAAADQVYLRGGGMVSGEVVSQTPASVVVDVGPGRMTLPMARVERIVAAPSALAEFRARAARVPARDAAAWVALGRWAESRDLLTQAREAYEQALSIDPRNPAANGALGRVQLDGQWVSQADANRARGLVEFEGQWLTPAERGAILAERAADARARGEAAEAEARAREAEARARAAEADARRAEAETAAGDGIPYPYVYGGGGYGGVIYGPGGVILGPGGVVIGVGGGRSGAGHGRSGRGHGDRSWHGGDQAAPPPDPPRRDPNPPSPPAPAPRSSARKIR